MRTLLNGRRVSELKKPIKWGFESKCPSKWVHVDCESGSIYVKNPKGPGWLEPTDIQADAAFRALKFITQEE
jgi:hypothetical protein